MAIRNCQRCIYYTPSRKYCLKLNANVEDPNNPPCLKIGVKGIRSPGSFSGFGILLLEIGIITDIIALIVFFLSLKSRPVTIYGIELWKETYITLGDLIMVSAFFIIGTIMALIGLLLRQK